MKGLVMRRRTAATAALLLALGVPTYLVESGSLASAKNAKKGGDETQSLAQAIDGAGIAAGDPVYGAEGASLPDSEGTKSNGKGHEQAKNVKVKKDPKDKAEADGKKTVTDSAKTAGCVPEYGNGTDCLPTVSPDQAQMPTMFMPWTCSQVRVVLPNGIKVKKVGIDPQHLDSNSDGVACGAGDA